MIMTRENEILQYLHYNPGASRSEIETGMNLKVAQDAELSRPENVLLGRMLRRLKKSEYDWSSIS